VPLRAHGPEARAALLQAIETRVIEREGTNEAIDEITPYFPPGDWKPVRESSWGDGGTLAHDLGLPSDSA
jgi:hypothetical protein